MSADGDLADGAALQAEPGAGRRAIALPDSGTGGPAAPVWLPAHPRAAASGRCGGQCKARAPALPAGELQVQRRKRRHGVAVERRPLQIPTGPNQVWSMDFVSDSLEYGRRLKCLTIVDDFTKESVDIVVDHGIGGAYVARALDQAGKFRGLPKVIRTDQGPEFTGNALDQWACKNGVALRLIQAGKPTQNAYIESFNGKFPRRMLERALVPVAGGGSGTDRGLAPGLQPEPAAQRVGVSDAGGVRRCLSCPASRARQAGSTELR